MGLQVAADADAAMVSGPASGLTLSGRLRIGLRLALLIVGLLLAVPLHFIWRVMAYGSPVPQFFLRAVARIVGARVRSVGTPLRRDVFFIANHVSWIDIPAIAGASGTAFVAKAEIAAVPLIGWLCRLNRTVFVQREARLDVAGQINALREALADNWSVTIFPEGTTTDGQSLLPFKTAMLKVLEPPPPGAMVQPILLDYGPQATEISWIGEETGLANALRILARRGTFDLWVHFLEPFSPADHAGRKAIAAEARARIEAALTATLGTAPRQFGLTVPAVGYFPSQGQEAADRANS